MELNTPLKDQQKELDLIMNLDVQSQQKQSQEEIGQKCINVNKSRDGDYAEYFVALTVWEKGGEVYKNLGKSGLIDLVLKINNQVLLCDVKCNTQQRVASGDFGYYQPSITMVPDERIYMICFHPLTKKITWHTKRIPKGLENYWE